MEITEIIAKSGDAQFIDCYIKSNVLIIILEIDEIGGVVELKINSNLFFVNIPENDSVYRNCFVELVKIEDYLQVENDIYIPSKDFGKMMQEKKKNLNLAYGLRKKEFELIFSLVGVTRMLSCIVKKKENIEVDFI